MAIFELGRILQLLFIDFPYLIHKWQHEILKYYPLIYLMSMMRVHSVGSNIIHGSICSTHNILIPISNYLSNKKLCHYYNSNASLLVHERGHLFLLQSTPQSAFLLVLPWAWVQQLSPLLALFLLPTPHLLLKDNPFNKRWFPKRRAMLSWLDFLVMERAVDIMLGVERGGRPRGSRTLRPDVQEFKFRQSAL